MIGLIALGLPGPARPQNQAMQALARKLKADLRIDHAETVGDIIPRAATPFSVLMEALDGAREFGQAAIDVRRRLRLQSGRKAPLPQGAGEQP
jgi:hypothetical protein